jgi:hypothetical protein
VYKRRNIMELSFLKSFISGGIAGVLAKSSVAPIERVKLIFQTSSDQFSYRKGVKCLSDILRTEGLRSLWRGNGLVAVRIFPYSAIQFTVYDSLKYVRIRISLVNSNPLIVFSVPEVRGSHLQLHSRFRSRNS